MIAYITGKITYKSQTDLIIETGGLGYQVHITTNTYHQIAKLKEVKLLTHFVVKEDSQQLYGFAEADEKVIFEHLISVSGVGVNTARVLLSALTAEQVRSAIISENIAVLKRAKGIGPKAAKRIVLELKDKLVKDSGAISEAIASSLMTENPAREEALSALLALGFNKIQIQKTLNKIIKQKPDISDSGELIKLSLAQLA
ncbi:MAG: Holliday junction branch migration protein RuvA [Saprospiraceae bacterium]|nr:Holliday junction branch migration protein RuvA [Saprospiraceae bacterium]